MSDHTTRRDARVRHTLEAIDTVTTPQCMTCGAELSPRGPSDLFCDQFCQDRGLLIQGDEQLLERWRAYDRDRGAPTFRRLYLNNPVAAAQELVSDIEHAGASTDEIMAAADQLAEAMGEATIRIHIPAPAPKTRLRDRIKLRDRINHDSHAREMRGAAATAFIAVVAAVLGAAYLIDASWIAGGLVTAVAVVSGGVSWVSWGNARAAAATCRTCHPPCDDDPFTTTG